MASVNKVILIGNLGKDPEIRYMPDGGAVVNLSIATSDRWKDKATGEQKEATEWHRVVIYGKLAEIAGQYAKKGKPLYLEGKLKTRKWQDQSGVDKYTTEIVADTMQLLGGRDSSDDQDDGGFEQARQPQQRQQAPQQQAPQQRNAYADARGGGNSRPAQQRQPQSINDLDQDIPF